MEVPGDHFFDASEQSTAPLANGANSPGSLAQVEGSLYKDHLVPFSSASPSLFPQTLILSQRFLTLGNKQHKKIPGLLCIPP